MGRHGKIRKIINLSPLVDVFMIVIFWYIMFSSQNLKNQEAQFQEKVSQLESTVSGLEDMASKLESTVAGLEAEKEVAAAELDALRQQARELELENGRMAAVMEYEGQYLLLWLSGGLAGQRELKVILDGEAVKLPFSNGDREDGTLSNQLEETLSGYFDAGKRYNIIFLYDGGNSYSRDLQAIETAIFRLQKEYYFVYTKVNLSR